MFSFGRLDFLYCVDNMTPIDSFSFSFCFPLISIFIDSYLTLNGSIFPGKYKSVSRMDRPYYQCLQHLVSALSSNCKELSLICCLHTLWK